MELLLIILLFIWFIITMLIAGKIFVYNEDLECSTFIGIKEYICNLFINKNLFGTFLSIIMLIISIPALFIVLVLQLLMWLLEFLEWVWRLGNKT